MERRKNFYLLFFFMLFLAVPVFAQDAIEKAVPTEAEDVTLPEEPGEGVITGTVVSLDKDAGLISVKTTDGVEKAFSVIGGETILWRGIEDIELATINVGEEAEVGYYTDDSGKLIASWVDIIVEEKTAPPSETPGQGAQGTTEPLPEETGPITEE